MIIKVRGLSSPTIFLQNPSETSPTPPHLLEPSMIDLLCGISALDHRYTTFFAQPLSWSLLHEALIENNHQTFIRDFCSRPSSWTSIEAFSGQAFVLDLRHQPSPASPSSRPSSSRPSSSAFSGQAFIPDLRRQPSLARPLSGPSSFRPSSSAFSSQAFIDGSSTVGPPPEAFSNRLSPGGLLLSPLTKIPSIASIHQGTSNSQPYLGCFSQQPALGGALLHAQTHARRWRNRTGVCTGSAQGS